MVINANYCVKHNQDAKHANAGGSGGMPPGKFWKSDPLRLNLMAFRVLVMCAILTT